MNHQPYEVWILEPLELNGSQRAELEKHLEGCEACRNLQAGWTAVKVELRAPEMAAPRAGFTNRWKAGAAERRLREQRRQAWKLFLTCSGTAAALFVVFIAYLLSTTTPVEWIQAGVRVVSSSVGMVGAFRDVTMVWLQYTPPAVNVALWISLAVTFCALTFVWVFALWRTSLGGALQK
jgi:hypothetical protein